MSGTVAPSDYEMLALRTLEHEDAMANRDSWIGGDRDAYLTRHLLRAQALATLAVAEQLTRVANELASNARATDNLGGV